MDTTSDNNAPLHTAVWATINQIAQEEATQIGKPISADFVASLANVTYKQMELFALDTEAFSSHARRTVVNGDDVLLCARRNESLQELLAVTLQDLSKKKNKS